MKRQNTLRQKFILIIGLMCFGTIIYAQEKPVVLSTNPKEIKKNYLFYMVPIMNLSLDGEQSTFSHGIYHVRNWSSKLSSRISFNQILLGNGDRYKLRDFETPFYYDFQGIATYNLTYKEKPRKDEVPIKSAIKGNTKTVTWLIYDGIVAQKIGINLGFAKKHIYSSEYGISANPIMKNGFTFSRTLMSVNTTSAIVGINYSRQVHVKVKYEDNFRDKNLDWRIYADLMPLLNPKTSYGETFATLPGYSSELVNTWNLVDLGINPVKMGYRFGWERVYNGFGQGLAIIFGAEIGRTNIFNPKAVSFKTKIGIGF